MKDSQLSPPCYVRNLPWKIMVMPRSSQTQERQPQRSLGFFLQCNGESESTSWSCYAVAELRLLSCKPGQDYFSRSKFNHYIYLNYYEILDCLQILLVISVILILFESLLSLINIKHCKVMCNV